MMEYRIKFQVGMNSSMLDDINVKIREIVKDKKIDINDMKNNFLFGISK